MLEHHLQREILYTLVTNPSVRFAQLKPPGIDGNVFTYHLQQLIKQKLVAKNDDGSYSLTAQGKAAGINIHETKESMLRQAHSVIFMAVRNENGDYLLRRRLAHPVYGKLGFVHGEPVVEEATTETASKILEAKTGLQATFTPKSGGYIRILRGKELESFTHYTLLLAEGTTGKLIQTSKTGENIWLSNPDFSHEDMIPSMSVLVDALDSDNFIFQELTFQLS